MILRWIFPVDASGRVLMVPSSASVPPYAVMNGLKIDAQGRVVVQG